MTLQRHMSRKCDELLDREIVTLSAVKGSWKEARESHCHVYQASSKCHSFDPEYS